MVFFACHIRGNKLRVFCGGLFDENAEVQRFGWSDATRVIVWTANWPVWSGWGR